MKSDFNPLFAAVTILRIESWVMRPMIISEMYSSSNGQIPNL